MIALLWLILVSSLHRLMKEFSLCPLIRSSQWLFVSIVYALFLMINKYSRSHNEPFKFNALPGTSPIPAHLACEKQRPSTAQERETPVHCVPSEKLAGPDTGVGFSGWHHEGPLLRLRYEREEKAIIR